MLSCVCGYHEYQRIWMVAVGEELWYERKRPRNPKDPYAVVNPLGSSPNLSQEIIRQRRSAIACSKFRKCSMLLIIHVKKFHVLNFCCLTELRIFSTIETFANYGM